AYYSSPRPRGELPRTNNLPTATVQVPDRSGEHVHKARERKDKEDRQSECQMRLEDPMSVRDVVRGARLEGEDALRPHHKFDHLLTVTVLQRDWDGGEAETELRHQQHKDRSVAESRCRTDARIEQAPMQ